MTADLRFVFPFDRPPFFHNDDNGKLKGFAVGLVTSWMNFIHKFNVSFTKLKDFKNQRQVSLESLDLLTNNESDVTFLDIDTIDHLPKGVTPSVPLVDDVCLIFTSPKVVRESLEAGPGSVLKSLKYVNLCLYIAAVVIFLLMIKLKTKNSLTWQFILLFWRQKGIQSRYGMAAMFLIVFTFFGQILFIVFMKTDRVAKDSYTEINTLDDIRKNHVIPLMSSATHCNMLLANLTRKQRRYFNRYFRLIQPSDKLIDDTFDKCSTSETCALIESGRGSKLSLVIVCRTKVKFMLSRFVHISRPISKQMIVWAVNKRFELSSRAYFERLTYGLFEMGIYRERGLGTLYFGHRLFEMPPSQECVHKTLSPTARRTSITSPLSVNFYKSLIVLYFAVALIASTICMCSNIRSEIDMMFSTDRVSIFHSSQSVLKSVKAK